jgi:hypothetical protein
MQTTKGMPVAESVMAIGTDRYNLVLGMYVPNQDGILDRAGKLDGYRRHALAKVPNSLVGATLSSRDFKELAAYGTSAEQMAEISKAIDIASSEIERNSREHPDNKFGHVRMV